MSTFALDPRSSSGDIITALNYALANLGQGGGGSGTANVLIGGNLVQVSANGVVYSSNIGAISYRYPFVSIRYADTATGGGFSSNSTSSTHITISTYSTL